ncbi:MAG: hypothetical protein RSC28_01185 [Bacteroidales bacterium]
MQNKLQELTDKLYNEGLSKGKHDAEDMKAKAKKEAALIISDAQEKAKEIILAARKESDELKTKTENDIKMASSQTFAAIKQQIEKAIITKAISTPVKLSTGDKDFIQSIITTIISQFNSNSAEPVSLSIILPDNKKAELDNFLSNQISKQCSTGLDIKFSKSINNGFQIGPKGDGYMISFTDTDFENIIAEYLRPKTRTLLFGK